jgi:hypothetical protein
MMRSLLPSLAIEKRYCSIFSTTFELFLKISIGQANASHGLASIHSAASSNSARGGIFGWR